jgi:hypothetical protein
MRKILNDPVNDRLAFSVYLFLLTIGVIILALTA